MEKWKHESLVDLREKYSLKQKDKTSKIKVDDVVMIKEEEKKSRTLEGRHYVLANTTAF